MRSNKRLYIARKYYSYGYGLKTIYEEGLFDTYDLAYRFIEDISEEDHDRFLSEIVSVILNNSEPWESDQLWTFDRKGKLIRFYDSQNRGENIHVVEYDGYREIYEEPDPDSYTGKFNVGDIVNIKAFPWNWESRVPEDTIGVIAQIPIHYNVWRKQNKCKYGWDNAYVIYYIREGYLDHMHIKEEGLSVFQKEIPEKYSFIMVLSDHYNDKLIIKDEILKEIVDGKIFVEKVRLFNASESLMTKSGH